MGQVFGRKKTAVAVAYCKSGRGLVKINGCPLEFVQPEALRLKVMEPILLLGQPRFASVDIRIRVKGGGYTSQLYAIRQALGKSLVAFSRNTWMRPPSRRSRTFFCPTTALCLWPTPVAASPRSSVVPPPVLATRSPTVKFYG